MSRIALTVDDQRLLEKALMSSAEKQYDIEPEAPAAVPGESVEHILLTHTGLMFATQKDADRLRERLEAHFAPILADARTTNSESWRKMAFEEHQKRLAAEAALAGERERAAKIAETYGSKAQASQQPSIATNALVLGCEQIAAAIRAQG